MSYKTLHWLTKSNILNKAAEEPIRKLGESTNVIEKSGRKFHKEYLGEANEIF